MARRIDPRAVFNRVALLAMLLFALPVTARAQPSGGNLLGPAWGVRPWLNQYGVTFGLSETGEVFGNATGGLHRGATYDGLTEASVGVDLARAFGLQGGIFNVSAFQIHGRSLSQDNLDNINTISGIEASRATRLWELWYDQQFADGQFDTKIGLQSLDQEFITSPSAGLFANTMFGWPALPSYDMYAGGPAYPLSSLGVRGRANLGRFTVLGGVFDDNPGGGPFENDPQPANGGSEIFNLKTGALMIAEIDYALNSPVSGEMASDDASPGLPGLYKLGAWFDSANFPDLRYDDRHRPFSSPDSDGNPLMRRHNFAVYGVVDQMIWRPNPNKARSISVFTRLMGAPGDRNLVDFAGNLGLALHEPLEGRSADSLVFGGGFTKLARNATEASRSAQDFAGPGVYSPIRTSESYLELAYQYFPVAWLLLQPDLQYVFTPGGGIANSSRPDRRISNEFVAGLRFNVSF
ncbi:carbohydrate porin [Acetobacteraceae bacterium KSS8]|uniref:Carbohydrate porin n=1 Tax=Endosaccharibacter trunci TaxID=2812733 RepID=A0ABT1W6N9_9PROT|nr:carbohydrate porin [Acetobacteraceae bacterium KSS8]